ncbi:STAS domain-containing protein [Streptomyces sp. cg36]|uniref:STAS domain-containing protein n=1 Tax=Streptomyces sp. cg36 TaxID=3238798 RepID=UPI0034E21924
MRVRETEGRTVVELLGEIDMAVVLRFTAEMDVLTEGPRVDIVVDLGPVEFMDCCGLGMLCRARRRVEERSGRLTLVRPGPGIRRMLRVLGLDEVFAVADTLDEAVGRPGRDVRQAPASEPGPGLHGLGFPPHSPIRGLLPTEGSP